MTLSRFHLSDPKSPTFHYLPDSFQSKRRNTIYPGFIRGPPSASLEISYKDRIISLNDPAPDLVIGRHRGCDLIVQNALVSLKHATIICKRGKFFLLDHSSNGSFVGEANQQPVVICRDMAQLKKSGIISLGIEPKNNPEHLIRFRNTIAESVEIQIE